jgi:hypothetical protein
VTENDSCLCVALEFFALGAAVLSYSVVCCYRLDYGNNYYFTVLRSTEFNLCIVRKKRRDQNYTLCEAADLIANHKNVSSTLDHV